MKRRALVIFLCVVLGPLALIAIALQTSWVSNMVRDQAQRKLAASLYSKVSIGEVKIRYFPPRIELYDVAITPRNPGVQEFKDPTLRVARAKVILRPLQLILSRIDIERVELEQAQADLSVVKSKVHGLPLPLVDSEKYPKEESPDFRLDAFTLRDGILHFTMDDPNLQIAVLKVRALGTLEADGSVIIDVEASGHRFHIKAGDADLEEPVGDIRGQVVLTGPRVEIRNAHAEVGPVVVEGNGVVMGKRGPTDADFSTLHVTAPLTLVQQFAGKTPAMTGNVNYTGSFAIKGKNILGRGNARIDDYHLDRFHLGAADADVEFAGTRAMAKRVVLKNAGGVLQGTAEMDWPEDTLTLKADMGLTDVSFARILDAVGVPGSHVDARVDGRVAINGSVDANFDVKGTADIRQRAFAWTTRGWDEPGTRGTNLLVPGGTVSGDFEVTKPGVHFTGVHAVAGDSRVTVDGDLLFRGAADLAFVALPVDLSEISPVGSVSLAGIGPATGRIHGDFEDLVIDSELDLDAVNVGGFDFGRGTGKLSFARMVLSSPGTAFTRGQSHYSGPWKVDFNDTPSLSFEANARDARVEDLADIVFGNLPASTYVQGGPISGHIKLEGPFDSLTGGYTAQGQNVVIKGEIFRTVSAAGRWQAGTISLNDFSAKKPSGALIWARGSMAPTVRGEEALGGKVDFEAHTARMTLADLDVMGHDSTVVSDLAMRLHFGGYFRRPDVSGRLDLGSTRFRGVALGPSQIDFQTVDDPVTHVHDWMTVSGLVAGGSIDAGGGVHLWQKDLLPFDVSFKAQRHSLLPYLYLANERLAKDEELRAFASGTFAVKGKLFDLSRSSVRAELDTLSLTKATHVLTNNGPIDLTFGDGKVEVRSLSLTGDETNFQLSGGEDSAGNLDFHSTGDLDLAFVELITDAFTRVEGVVRTDMTVSGTAHSPLVNGIADILGGKADPRGAVFKTRFFTQALEEVQGRISFTQDSIVLNPGLTGRFGGGGFEATGSMSLRGMAVSNWDLSARVNDATIRFPAHSLFARVSGPLEFKGPASKPVMSGDLEMSELKYTEKFDWKARAISFQKSHDVLAAPDESAKLFDLNIRLHAGENLVVDNQLVKIEFKTVDNDPLVIVGNSAQWGVLGAIETLPKASAHAANVANFQNNRFTVENARLDFKSSDSLDFEYDADVETRIRDTWTIDGRIQGRYSTGAVSYNFTSNPPLTSEDINLLIVAGYTQEESDNQGAGALGGIAASVIGQGLASQRGLGGVIPLDSFDVVPTISRGGQVGMAAVGRKQLYPALQVQGRYENTGRGSFQAEYRVNKTLHLTGIVTNEELPVGDQLGNSVNGATDVGADARFRFEWK